MRGVLFRLCCAAAVCGTAAASELGENALRAGDFRNAARLFRKEIAENRAGSEVWKKATEQLIRISIREGDWKDAETLYARLGEFEKAETPRMRMLHAAILFAKGEYAKTAEETGKATVPAPTPEEALNLFSLRHRALLAMQQYEAAEKAAAEFCAANPKTGAAGKMLHLYSALLAGDAETAQRLFTELEKDPHADGVALKKLRFMQQLREQKTPAIPDGAPQSAAPDELLCSAYLLLADRAESAARPDVVVAALKRAEESAPDRRTRRNVRSRLLNAYLSAGDRQKAADCAELLVQDSGGDPAGHGDALLRAARFRAETGKNDLAVRFYHQAIDDAALPLSCRLAAARECAALHSRAKEFEQAQKHALFLLENGSTEAERQEGNFLLGEFSYSRGDYRKAADFFLRSEPCPEWRDRSLFWLIQSRMQLNEWSAALDAAETLAAAKDPDFAASGAFYRAMLLEKLGRKADAANAYMKFCSAYPKSVYVRDALLHAALLKKELKEYGMALQCDMDFAARFPGDDEAPGALCRAFDAAFLSGNRSVMGEILKQLMTRYSGSPRTTEAVFREVDILRAEGRAGEALALLTRLAGLQTASNPELSGQILYEKARLLESMGRQNQALKELQTLLTNYPNSLYGADALLLAGSIRSDLGEYEQAAEEYRRAAALRPGGDFAAVCEGRMADCLYSRAALKYDEKLLSGALEIYRKLTASRDFRIAAQSWYMCGRCLELAGKDEEALAIYNDMLYGALSARKKSAPWSPEYVSRAVYAGCMIYIDDGSVSSAREAVRMLRLFRTLGVDTGEDFDAMEKKLRGKYRI